MQEANALISGTLLESRSQKEQLDGQYVFVCALAMQGVCVSVHRSPSCDSRVFRARCSAARGERGVDSIAMLSVLIITIRQRQARKASVRRPCFSCSFAARSVRCL